MRAEGADDAGELVVVDDLARRLPETVFLLVRPEGGVELRQTERGDVFPLAYSSMERLVAACGTGQPWVVVGRDQVRVLCDRLRLTMLALDALHPDGDRYPEPEPSELPELDVTEPEPGVGEAVWVPSRPARTGDREVHLELQPDATGTPTLLAFTSLDELRAGCGPHQAAVAVPVQRLESVCAQSGAQQVLFNPVLDEQSRHAAPVADWPRSRPTRGTR